MSVTRTPVSVAPPSIPPSASAPSSVLAVAANRDRGDDRADIRFENVSAHPGNIANVVSDGVRNYRRIPGIVFWDSRFNLPNKVGANVSSLGVNTAAYPSEQCD
jgi:hypothetical protein